MTEPATHPTIDETDIGVGMVCRWWVNIEHLVHDMALHAAVAMDPSFEGEVPYGILHLALSNMSMPDKVRTTSALIVDFWGGDDERTRAAMTQLDRLRNDLRNARNRCVHAMWDDAGHEHLRLGSEVKRVSRSDPPRYRLILNEPGHWRERHTIETAAALEACYHALVKVDNMLAESAARPAAAPMPEA